MLKSNFDSPYSHCNRRPRQEPKKATLVMHANKRLQERFGLSGKDRKQIQQMIKHQAKGVRFVESQSNRVSVFDVPYNGLTVRAVYDKTRHCLITVLTQDMNPAERPANESKELF